MSKTLLYEFLWHVDEPGYHWVDREVLFETGQVYGARGWKKTSLLREIPVPGHPQLMPRKRYAPLSDHQELFRVFADTEPTPSSARAFADRYGPLTIGNQFKGRSGTPDTNTDEPISLSGEPLELWLEQIRLMSLLVRLWDLIRAGEFRQSEVSAIARDLSLLMWQQDLVHTPKSYFRFFAQLAEEAETYSYGLYSVVSGLRRHSKLEHRLLRQDTGQYACVALQFLVNEQLRKAVSPQLLWDESWRGLQLHLGPKDLRGALWLQFAAAIDGGKSHTRCPRCKRWFEQTRKDRKYCSVACRVAGHRAKARDSTTLPETTE